MWLIVRFSKFSLKAKHYDRPTPSAAACPQSISESYYDSQGQRPSHRHQPSDGAA